LLGDDRVIFLVAFDADEPVGFACGYELPRRHGAESMLLVYEVGVRAGYRRRGIARLLLTELERIGRERGIGEAFVLTEPGNEAANALYASLGGERSDVVEWDWRYAES
jgi:ribosomal protein S18 acetylase RimI-like enzyme